MFKNLNRLVRGVLLAAFAAALYALWSERERAWPLVDWWATWSEAGFKKPDPMPRLTGVLLKFVPPETLQVRDNDKALWNFGLAGLDTIESSPPPAKLAAARKQLAAVFSPWMNQPVSIAYTTTTQLRTGLGLFYFGTNTTAHFELVRSGWYKMKPEVRRMLPFDEQVTLRAMEREARKAGRGAWAAIAGGGESAAL
jgi:endonuclease YncB( thermonuclease family)